MTAPHLWILAPLAVAVLMWVFQYRERTVFIAGLLCTGLLAWLAAQFPIAEAAEFGPWSFRIEPTLSVLGRTFTLDSGDRPFLVMVYLTAGLWFAWSRYAKVHLYFIPLGLSMVALLVAALAVEPFLYAALLIEMAVLVSIPMLSPPGRAPGQAVLRYITFQTLALPFILFTGWMLTGVESSPAEVGLIVRAGVLLGLGFAFLLAVFPFNTWIPLLAEQTHPYTAGFVLTTLQTAVLLFGVTFFERYGWLRSSPQILEIVRTTGSLMVLTGGLWAAFQTHLGRLLGYALIVETGFALIAISAAPEGGMGYFSMLFLPRLAGAGVWALSISRLRFHTGSMDLGGLLGAAKRFGVISVSLVIAQFSMAGLPLLASFPVKQVVLTQIANRSPILVLGVLIGSVGLFISAFRSLEALVRVSAMEESPGKETRGEQVVLVMGVIVLLLIGTLPQAFLSPMMGLFSAFSTLSW